MRAFGLKHTARDLAEQRGVPLLPGTGLLAGAGAILILAIAVLVVRFGHSRFPYGPDEEL